MNRLAMVDGETVWQELYPRGCGSLGLTGCSYRRCLVEVWNCVHVDISLGHAHRKARAVRQRAGDRSLWRAGATSIVGKDFCLQSRPTARCRAGPSASYCAMME